MTKDKIITEVWILQTRPDKPPPPESKQAIDAERRTIVAKLESGQVLTEHERARELTALRELLPRHEQKAIKRQRQLECIEQTLETAKQLVKLGAPLPYEKTALDYAARTYGFKTTAALAQWLKRARGKKTRR